MLSSLRSSSYSSSTSRRSLIFDIVSVFTLTKNSAMGIQRPLTRGFLQTSALCSLSGMPDITSLSRSLRVLSTVSRSDVQSLQGYSVPLRVNFFGVEWVKSKSSLRLCSFSARFTGW